MFNSTPMMHASGSGDLELVKLVRSYNGSLEGTLHRAAGGPPNKNHSQDGHITRFLIDEGADVNARDDHRKPEHRNGDTPLTVASANNNVFAAEVLLGKGANIFMADNDGNTALHNACRSGSPDIVDLILKSAKSEEEVARLVNPKNKRGETPLNCTYPTETRIIGAMLKNGASATIKNNQGVSITDKIREEFMRTAKETKDAHLGMAIERRAAQEQYLLNILSNIHASMKAVAQANTFEVGADGAVLKKAPLGSDTKALGSGPQNKSGA